MQRTYAKRALKRRARPDDTQTPRKRQQVYVEIVSPKKKSPDTHFKLNNGAPSSQHMPTSGSASGSPETPQKSPKNQASILTTPSRRGSQPGVRGSIVKRMLGRSKTESSLEATPSAHTLLATTSSTQIPCPTSSHSLPIMFPEKEPTLEASTPSSPKPLPVTRNIRTYAGLSRSFLVALPAPDADSLHTAEDDAGPHESYADLRTRWGIDLSEDDPHPYQDDEPAPSTPLKRNPSENPQSTLPPGMMNDLKSITELRSKGESRRFLDEVGYLFEGLNASSAIALRRASALEVVNKLCDLDFNRRAKTSDFYTRTWEKFLAARDGTSDRILDTTITFFATLAARDPRVLSEVAQQKDFIPTLVEILTSFDHRKDALAVVLEDPSDDQLKSYGILRTEITPLKSLARLVSKESASSFAHQPSARFFVSHSLVTLSPSLLEDCHLPSLLANLRADLGLLEPRIAAYESGLPIFPSTGIYRGEIPSLCHIEACLRLLDSYLLGQWSSVNPADDRPSSGLARERGLTSELILLCVASARLLEESQEEETDLARRCLCGALRVLTLLSHDDPWWCDAALDVPHALAFTATTAMRAQARWSQLPSDSVEVFDLLCLALGLVMNWATSSPRVAVLSRRTSIDPACPGSRLCTRGCQCPGPSQKSILACFAALHTQYVHSNEDRPDDDPPERAFLRGYTAILLGLLTKDDSANQRIVVSALPGTSPVERIRSLIAHCRAFLDLYNDTTPILSSSSSDLPRATPDGEPATYMVDRSGRARTWDERGREIAQNVIASLEICLRDIS